MKKLIRNVLKKMGYDIQHITINTSDELQICKSLQSHQIDTVFDIGANIGQFASGLRAYGYKGKIISFEPLSNAYQSLKRKSYGDDNWEVHEQCAIGDVDGSIDINISGNSVSSSILPMLERHSSAAKNSEYIDSEKVPIYRLDTIIDKYIHNESKYFLKVDTQGFEWQVLDGAKNTIKNAQGILCEMSLVHLYEGQKLWIDILERLQGEGFALWGIQRGFTDPKTGQTYQVDAIFFKD